jgi:hypothetical protein
MISRKPSQALLATAVLLLAGVPSLRGQSSNRWFVDFETGGVFPGYNDVRIPGNAGTRFSLTDDLTSESALFFRLRAGFRFHPRHTLTVLFAPLSISGSGSLGFPLHYNGLSFPAGTPLDSDYKFNSYRLSWRYGIKEGGKLRFGLGLTAKIRDAHIEISGGGQTTRNSNVGGVPLLNFLLEWRFSPLLRILFEGDAAAAPQGRAEDVELALVYQKSENWSVRLGYRILEGGADNDKVYSFALFNYLLIGVTGYF